MVLNNNYLSLTTQNIHLKQLYPDSHIRRFREEYLIWTDTITPSPLGGRYKVKMVYIKNKCSIEFYVVEPKPLKLAEGKDKLPHVYSHEEQKLCLFFPDGKEWTPKLLLSETIVPWAYEWLFHYELWLGSGIWKGGGKGHH